LRERGSDILKLSRYFLGYFNERYSCQHQLSSDDEAALLAHSWPGNVRELANTVERAVVLAGPSGLEFQFEPTPEDPSQQGENSQAMGTELGQKFSPADELRVRRAESERATILKALEHSRWNKTQTAVALGISRRSLLYKIKEYAIS
jgi:DNA-binding NtrC family response regulator